MYPLKVGTKIVAVGPHRRVVTVVESYRDRADIVYLALDRWNRPHDVSHRALSRGVRRGDYALVGGDVA